MMSLFAFFTNAYASNSKITVMRFVPGEDPKQKLEQYVKEKKIKAAVIVSAVGSLTTAVLRYANVSKPATLQGHFEVVSLSGTLGVVSGSHLHMSVSDSEGKTLGGHLVEGSKIYTTLEVAIAELTDIEFKRERDPVSTWEELKVVPRQ